jgi:hypothetical protein
VHRAVRTREVTRPLNMPCGITMNLELSPKDTATARSSRA